VSLAFTLLNDRVEETLMANRRKPTMPWPDPTMVTAAAFDAGMRAVEMSAAVARGLTQSALAAARAMSESFARAAEETTRSTTDVARDGVERAKRVAPRATPRPRRTSRTRKTQSGGRRAA